MSGSIRKVVCPGCKMPFEVIFKEKLPRSNPQNSYFHGPVVGILSRHLGYTEEEMKDILKGLFLSEEIEIDTKDGKIPITVVKSTASLKTDEFAEFIDKCVRWASFEHGCYIPPPENNP